MYSRVLFSHRTLGLGFTRRLSELDSSEGVSASTAALRRGEGSLPGSVCSQLSEDARQRKLQQAVILTHKCCRCLLVSCCTGAYIQTFRSLSRYEASPTLI